MTPDETAFHKVIVEDSGNDVLRLVFADWLDEHDQPERAEFIRLQIERASLPANDPRQQELAKRDLDLRELHSQGWRNQLPTRKGIVWQRFWRGFVSGADVQSWKYYRIQADAMFAVTPIQFLRFHGLNYQHCWQLVKSPYLGRLLGLDFSHSLLGDEGVQILAECAALKNLRSLVLAGLPRGSFRPSRKSSLTDTGALTLASSPYLDKLEKLNLRHHSFSEAAKHELRARFRTRVLLS